MNHSLDWRWFGVLAGANALDLAFTYAAVGRGIEEWNPILRPILMTPWPAAIKFGALALLAFGLWRLSDPRRIFALVKAAAVAYLAVLAMHAVGLSI